MGTGRIPLPSLSVVLISCIEEDGALIVATLAICFFFRLIFLCDASGKEPAPPRPLGAGIPLPKPHLVGYVVPLMQKLMMCIYREKYEDTG